MIKVTEIKLDDPDFFNADNIVLSNKLNTEIFYLFERKNKKGKKIYLIRFFKKATKSANCLLPRQPLDAIPIASPRYYETTIIIKSDFPFYYMIGIDQDEDVFFELSLTN